MPKGEKLFKHGYSTTKLYLSWNQMIQRCTNPNDASYKNYGGRGITVCNEWINFLTFRFQMRKKYLNAKRKYKGQVISIERINNNDNYCYNNCTFILKSKQSKNRRTVYPCKAINRKTGKEVYGKSQTELARKLNLSTAVISRNVNNKAKARKWIINYI